MQHAALHRNAATTVGDGSSSSDGLRSGEPSLDATFALLNDVRAQSFALQLRLRNSLPMRWSSNALVMQRGTRTKQVPGVDDSRWKPRAGQKKDFEIVGDDGGDLFSGASSARDPLEEEDDSMWSRQRYRRRIEWDVSRRIARIDLELQKVPPGQRFWNKKRLRPQQHYQVQQQVYSHTRPGEMREQEQEGGNPRKQQVDAASSKPRAKQTSEVLLASASDVIQGKQKKHSEDDSRHPKSALHRNGVSEPDTRARWSKPARKMAEEPKTALRTRSADGRGKENQAPRQEGSKTVRPVEATEIANSAALHPDLDVLRSVRSETHERVTMSPPKNEQDKLASTDQGDALQPGKASTVAVESSKADKLSHELFLDLNETLDDAQPHDTTRYSGEQSRQHGSAAHVASSIGRQVLSEFRNVPSLAVYGPPALTGNAHLRQLNSDVLRRLFSDLDTDRDGHVNRIETCMALHRLQISVPAPTIAAFFRRVHTEVSGPGVNERTKHRGNVDKVTDRQPLREVINYKQFVAFVTAANDRQREKNQFAQQQHGKQRSANRMLTAPAAPVEPSASRKQTRNAVIPPTSFTASISVPLEQEKIRYELDAPLPDAEERLEQKVLSNIPDYLVTKLLSEQSDQVRAERATLAVVRESMEKLLSSDPVDEKMVQEIAQELIREHLQRGAPPTLKEGDEDLTGLKRAAAYFDKQPLLPADGDDSVPADGGDCDDVNSWVGILTEEQVSGLVHEILKDRLDCLPLADEVTHASNAFADGVPSPANTASEVVARGKPEDESEKQNSAFVEDKETDTIDFLSTHVGMVAEKSIQVEDGDTNSAPAQQMVFQQEQPRVERVHGAEQVAGVSVDHSREFPTRTNLAKAIFLSSEQPDVQPTTKRVPAASSFSMLRQLRQERKRYQAETTMTAPPQAKLDNAGSTVLRAAPDEREHESHVVGGATVSRRGDEDADSNAAGNGADLAGSEDMGEPPVDEIAMIETLPPIAMTEKKLHADEMSERSSIQSDLRSSSSSLSFRDVESSGESRRSWFSELDIPRRTQSSSYQRSARRAPRKKWRSSSIEDRSVRSNRFRESTDSGDLSEGEIERRPSLDLSDGEIYGNARSHLVRQKNASNRFFNERRSDESSASKSSIESGELLPIVSSTAQKRNRARKSMSIGYLTSLDSPIPFCKLYSFQTNVRATYRQKVLDLSQSSVESGELEDGMLA